VTKIATQPPCESQFRPELQQYLIDLFGAPRAARLAKALREPGASFFLRTNTLRITADALVTKLEEENISATIPHPELDAIAIPIQPAGPVPRHKHLVVADKVASENVLLGSHLFFPGVKRTDNFEKGSQVTVVNPRGHIVGGGIAQVASKKMPAQKHGIAVKITEAYYTLPSISELDTYKRGLFYSQALPAMFVAPILDPQPDETIIDFCAAPGGKTTHLAQLLNNEARILAVDRSRRRVERLIAETLRLGITCVTPFVGRAKEFVERHPRVKADRVLVDPPCTALGVRPKLYDDTTAARIHSTASYQRDILQSAVQTLRTGGTLVYSTCTLTPEENEHNVQYLMDSFNMTLEHQSPCHGTLGLVGSPRFRQRVQRFYPDIHDLPGYFIAKLTKR
jgi:16S rRNA C967 or C1407 C5-methylase (RsmB/RsmF family)